MSPDGKEAGMSASSLAKLCGVNKSTIKRDLLGTFSELRKTTHKALESFTGKDLYVAFEPTNTAKPITAEACTCIIEYYAFEATKPSEVAQKAYRLFAKAGIHAWILSQVGFKVTATQEPLDTNLAISGLDAVKQLAQLYINLDDNLKDQPGLALQVADLSTRKPNTLKPAKVTLKDYIATKGIELSKGDMSTLAAMVSWAYKNHYQKSPDKVYGCFVT